MSDTLAIVGAAPQNGLPAFACPNGLIIAAWIIEFVLRDSRPDRVVSGGASGVDALAKRGAAKHGIAFTEHTPTVRKWAGPGGFQERNTLIAGDCDRLLRIARAESRSYGSGWTADLAARLGKPVNRLFIHRDGLVTRDSITGPLVKVGPAMGLTWTVPQPIGGTIT